jgi:small subunit ribosomal protein S6
MQNQYETTIIITPILTDEQFKECIGTYKKYIKDNGCEIVFDESWGLKKLAYPIDKKNNGYYYTIEFKSDPEFISKLEIEFKRDEKVLRFLTIKLDKYGVDYNDRKRKGEFKKKITTQTENA